MSQVYGWRDAPPAELAVIGSPVGHSLSPRMQNAALRALGIDWTYVAIEVGPGEVIDALDHLGVVGYVGVNVTLPHKEEAYRWVGAENCDEFTRKVGACNTIRFASALASTARRASEVNDPAGMNTDGPGLISALGSLGVKPCKALVLGAGGSARATCAALEDAGYDLAIYNRTSERAEALISDLQLRAEVLREPTTQGVDLAINTTSAGHEGLAPEIHWSGIGMAYDLSYTLGPTPFLKEAAAHGWRVEDGRSLLVHQGMLSLEWWSGREAPRDVMWEAVR